MINGYRLLVVCSVIGHAKIQNERKKMKKGQIQINGTIKLPKTYILLHFVHKIRGIEISLYILSSIYILQFRFTKVFVEFVVYHLRANICSAILFFFLYQSLF